MKLEYLATGLPDCPLLRLYGFTPAEASQLQVAIVGLASGAAERIQVDRLPFVTPVGACRLALVGRSWDQAVWRVGVPAEFECGFTPGTWDRMAVLVEPFAVGTIGFQWLAGVPGEASLLLSTCGGW
jgi:hypothetical protein